MMDQQLENCGHSDHLSMISYGMGILPLIRKLFVRKSEFPSTKQQWFGDDGSTVRKFLDIPTQFERL